MRGCGRDSTAASALRSRALPNPYREKAGRLHSLERRPRLLRGLPLRLRDAVSVTAWGRVHRSASPVVALDAGRAREDDPRRPPSRLCELPPDDPSRERCERESGRITRAPRANRRNWAEFIAIETVSESLGLVNGPWTASASLGCAGVRPAPGAQR